MFGSACSSGDSSREPNSTVAVPSLPPVIDGADADIPPEPVRAALDDAVIGTHRLTEGEFVFPVACDDGTRTVDEHEVSDGWLTPEGLSAFSGGTSQPRYRCDLRWSGDALVACFAGPERFTTAAETQRAGGEFQPCLGTDPPIAFVSIANMPRAEWIAIKQGQRWVAMNAEHTATVRLAVADGVEAVGRARLTVRWVSREGERLAERTVNAQAAG